MRDIFTNISIERTCEQDVCSGFGFALAVCCCYLLPPKSSITHVHVTALLCVFASVHSEYMWLCVIICWWWAIVWWDNQKAASRGLIVPLRLSEKTIECLYDIAHTGHRSSPWTQCTRLRRSRWQCGYVLVSIGFMQQKENRLTNAIIYMLLCLSLVVSAECHSSTSLHWLL